MIDGNRWKKLTFYQQMGNITSEISRAIRFKNENDIKHMDSALLRLIELLDLTIEDDNNRTRLRELCRFKEVLGDWYQKTRIYHVKPEALKNYSLQFAKLTTRKPR